MFVSGTSFTFKAKFPKLVSGGAAALDNPGIDIVNPDGSVISLVHPNASLSYTAPTLTTEGEIRTVGLVINTIGLTRFAVTNNDPADIGGFDKIELISHNLNFVSADPSFTCTVVE